VGVKRLLGAFNAGPAGLMTFTAEEAAWANRMIASRRRREPVTPRRLRHASAAARIVPIL
jgi:hypothetical protein